MKVSTVHGILRDINTVFLHRSAKHGTYEIVIYVNEDITTSVYVDEGEKNRLKDYVGLPVFCDIEGEKHSIQRDFS